MVFMEIGDHYNKILKCTPFTRWGSKFQSSPLRRHGSIEHTNKQTTFSYIFSVHSISNIRSSNNNVWKIREFSNNKPLVWIHWSKNSFHDTSWFYQILHWILSNLNSILSAHGCLNYLHTNGSMSFESLILFHKYLIDILLIHNLSGLTEIKDILFFKKY